MARVKLLNLQPGKNYVVQIRANDGQAVSQWSRKFAAGAIDDPTIPAEPTGFNFVNNETSSFFADWDDVTQNDDGSVMQDFDHYQLVLMNGSNTVSVRTKDTKYTLTAEANKDWFSSDNYPVSTVSAKVRTVDAFGNFSTFTDTISDTNVDPGNAESLDAIGIPDAIRVKWDAPSPLRQDFMEYSLHRSKVDGSFTISPANRIWTGRATAMIDQSTDYSTDHFYKVVVRDVFGNTATTGGAVSARPIDPSGGGGGGGGGAPSGPAGGDLAGTYPNPSIAANAIDATKLASNAVTNAKIATGAVDSLQIASDAVTTAKIANGAVDSLEIATGAIVATKIANGVITDVKMDPANVDGVAATPSLRTLGTGGSQAAAGNDARLADARDGKARDFQTFTPYVAAQLAVFSGTLYRANANFTSTGSFNSANWTAVGGGGGGGGFGGVIDGGDAFSSGPGTIDGGGA